LRLAGATTAAARLHTQQPGAQTSLRRLEQRKPFLLALPPRHHFLTTHTHSSKQEHLELEPSRLLKSEPQTSHQMNLVLLARLAHEEPLAYLVQVG
jgi:hypothetical protein